MKKSVEKLIELLRSPDPDERRQGAEALQNYGDFPEVIISLRDALKDPDKGVRDASAESLLKIGGEKVAEEVAKLLEPNDVSVRNLAAEILVKLGKDAVKPLFKYTKHSDKDVRKFAVDILGLIASKEAVPVLIERLKDSDENVVSSAIEALGNIGDRSVVPELIKMYETTEYARSVIIESIGKIGSPEANDFLMKVYSETEDPLEKYAVIEAFGKTGGPDKLEFLRKLLSDPDPIVKKQAVFAIVEICSRAGCDVEGGKSVNLNDFIEKAIDVYHECEDSEFKLAFLKFASMHLDVEPARKVLIYGLYSQDEKISGFASDVIISNARLFLEYVLEDDVFQNKEEFVDFVGALFYNRGDVFEDREIADKVCERLVKYYDEVSGEHQMVISDIVSAVGSDKYTQILNS